MLLCQQDLSMVSIDGRFAARLPDSSGNAKFPSWSPFGKWYLFLIKTKGKLNEIE